MDNGEAIRSTIIMTPTNFMTEEAWEKATPHIVKGLRNANPIVADNTQWRMLVMFNGFGTHTSSLKPMQYFSNNKIMAGKEEGDYFHCNQSYGIFVEKIYKTSKTESLSMLHRTTLCINRAGVDQWGLIHVGIFAVYGLKEETWKKSFRACNMAPRLQLRFDLWCKNIEGFLQAVETFKEEEPISMYTMLPSTWNDMMPAEKINMMNVIDLNGGVF